MAISNIRLTAQITSVPAFPGSNIVVDKPTMSQAVAEVQAVAQARLAAGQSSNAAIEEFLAGF